MDDREIVKLLAEKVMGWTWWNTESGEDAPEISGVVFGLWDESEPMFSLYEDPESGDVTRHWNPLTSIADAFEVQSTIPEEKQLEFARQLMLIVDPDGTALRSQIAWRCANATARQRCLAAVRALGGGA